MLRTIPLGVALGALLVLPAVASGEVLTLGSDLAVPAELAEAHPVDTAYWHAAVAGGASPAMPADGNVSAVRVRGFALSSTPAGGSGGGEREVFVQALAPESGTFRVRSAGTSAPFVMPGRGEGDANTETTFRPDNLCVRSGDRVALSTVGGAGGNFPEGTPLQIFAPRPGAVASRFTKEDGTSNGDLFTGGERVERPETELLMQIVLRTGADASAPCRTSTTPAPNPTPTPTPTPGSGEGGSGGDGGSSAAPARVPGARLSVTRTGRASLSVFCSKSRDCRGALTLTASGTTLGRASYTISRGETKTVRVRLRAAGLRLVKRRRYRLTARATLVTQPGGAANTSSRSVRVKRRGA